MGPDEIRTRTITYIPLRKGFLYLLTIVDLYSRYVVSWKLSNSLDTGICMQAPRDVHLAWLEAQSPPFRPRMPINFGNFVEQLQSAKFKISWSGRKPCYDNSLMERLWQTVK